MQNETIAILLFTLVAIIAIMFMAIKPGKNTGTKEEIAKYPLYQE